jgi:hypothetical protein
MIGPLYLCIATYVSLLNNICISWYLLTLTQMTLVKVLMIFKWSFMTGIDDNFVGGFLILVNVGFLSLSQLARHWLGSMYESQEFHMLSGKICIYDNKVVQFTSWLSPFYLLMPNIEGAYYFDKEFKLFLRLIWVLKSIF